MDRDETGLRQVGDENPGHAEGHRQERGDLRHRFDLAAQVADPLVLREQARHLHRVRRRADQRLDGELVTGPGPAARHRVGPHQGLVTLDRVAGGGRIPVRVVRCGGRCHAILRAEQRMVSAPSGCGRWGAECGRAGWR
ncbi:hypothetical protein STTU_1723 [Streptomyces sp. Tu6071]|nr:hypothetical protein STTU_1723 [Streptomyces sp. Tu6071]